MKPALKRISFNHLLIGVFFIVLGYYFNHYYQTISSINMPQNAQEMVSHDANFQPIKATVAYIYTDVLLKPSPQTQVTIPFKFSSQPQTIWLILEQTGGNHPSQFLISHPQLNSLTWSNINDGYNYLWQKRPTYKSIEDFMKTPPSKQVLLIDSVLAKFYQNQITGTELTNDINPNDYEYILTTFKPPQKQSDYLISNLTIDASFANIDNNQLTWALQSEQANDENPYYLGPINIGEK